MFRTNLHDGLSCFLINFLRASVHAALSLLFVVFSVMMV